MASDMSPDMSATLHEPSDRMPKRSSLKGGSSFRGLSGDEEDADSERRPARPSSANKRASWAQGEDIEEVHQVFDTYYQRTFLQKHFRSICCAVVLSLPILLLLMIALRATGGGGDW